MKFSLLFLLLILAAPATRIKVWKEKRGVVVLEAEHNQERNDLPVYWANSTVIPGYTGTGFLRWSGTSFIKDDFGEIDAERIITYYIWVEKEGVYYLKIKGTIFDEPSANILVRINNSEWKQFVIPNNGTISWDINSAADSYPVLFQNDYHKIEIAGTSAGFLLDKFAFVHESLINPSSEIFDTGLIDNLKESRSQYLPGELFSHLNVP